MVWRGHLKKYVLIQMHTYLHLHFRLWHWRCRVLFYPIMETQLFLSLVGGLLTFEKHLKDSDFSPITDYLILQSQTFTYLVHIICILATKDLTGWKQKGTRRQKREEGTYGQGTVSSKVPFLTVHSHPGLERCFELEHSPIWMYVSYCPNLSERLTPLYTEAVEQLWYLTVVNDFQIICGIGSNRMGVTEWVCNLPATQ